MGRFWEGQAETGRKSSQMDASLICAKPPSVHSFEKSAKLHKDSARTAKPPFVGSIPTGASLFVRHDP